MRAFGACALAPQLVAIVLAACATPELRLLGPKTVAGLRLAPYAIHEECVALARGERIDYRFTSDAAVAFNIHYHEDNAVVMPISREQTHEERGDFTADRQRVYCLMWEAGAEVSVLDYRVRPLPPR